MRLQNLLSTKNKIIESGSCLPPIGQDLVILVHKSKIPFTVSGFLSADLGKSDRISVVILAAHPGGTPRPITRATLAYGDEATLIIPPITVHGSYHVVCSTVSGRMRKLDYAFYRQ